MRVGVSLGLTLCTDPDQMNFAKFGFNIEDIDTDGDIEAQANTGLSAILKTFEISNEGMEKAVTESLSELTSIEPAGIRSELDKVAASVDRISEKLIPNIIGQVKKLTEQVDALPTGGGSYSPSEEEEG